MLKDDFRRGNLFLDNLNDFTKTSDFPLISMKKKTEIHTTLS